MIELQNVTKIYKSGTVGLEDVSLKIGKGEFVFIVGSSGSGKSTFLKLLLKEIDVTKGRMKVNGQDVTRLKRRKIPELRQSMGIVFQDFRLLPKKTLYENVAFAMEVRELGVKEIRRHVPMALSMVGLGHKARCYPHQISGGEQQRTAVARAIVNNPQILICDEPTGNLDPETSWDIINLLSDINHRGTTVIIATHDREIVDVMKKRVIEIDGGKIARDEKKGGYRYED
ncbi:cell division ATP-binding protein FtsE [Vallitalea okinawensis]|uniref:cell division ATP-binding protein FtsE n=1 Tax=Vallitalea okinawensis TaxID=2078660 RepID=UPI000CFCEAF3|nr:cell division ATP-binding protein FtsE [Vallitalea okinawensis]